MAVSRCTDICTERTGSANRLAQFAPCGILGVVRTTGTQHLIDAAC
jgi:hypothetical protein